MRLVCAADLHLGRRSSRLRAGDGRAVSCAAGWLRLVELALAESVDAVVLAGDVVDRANRFYEATGPLEDGIRRLADAGVVTVAVAGNHDHDVLPWLVEGFGPDAFRLVGRGGRWERTTLERDGAALHIDGWSFPAGEVRESPLAGYDLPAAEGVPVLGLLHADLDVRESRYAPVTLAGLRARPAGFWLLGHIHAPRLAEAPGAAAVLYPGSPQAMDPGEPGEHGAWIVDVGPDGRFDARPVPLSSVRYDVIEVDVAGVAEPLELDRRVADAVRAHLAAVAPHAGPLRWLCCRLRIVGRTPLHRGLEARLRALPDELTLVEGDATAVIERVEIATRPAYELAALARGNDPPAVLAALIQALDRADVRSPYADLVRDAARRVDAVHSAKPYLGLPAGRADEPDETAVAVRALAHQASRLLDELLAQKEAV